MVLDGGMKHIWVGRKRMGTHARERGAEIAAFCFGGNKGIAQPPNTRDTNQKEIQRVSGGRGGGNADTLEHETVGLCVEV